MMTTVDDVGDIIAAMDTKMLEHHLAQAQRHAVQGASLVAEQRERVAKLERLGTDCARAKRLLALFEELHAMHADDAERIRSKLLA